MGEATVTLNNMSEAFNSLRIELLGMAEQVSKVDNDNSWVLTHTCMM